MCHPVEDPVIHASDEEDGREIIIVVSTHPELYNPVLQINNSALYQCVLMV